MTSTQSAGGTIRHSQLGTLVMIGWSGENAQDGNDVPFLLTYSLGNGKDGPQAGMAAMEQLIRQIGLTIGNELLDGSRAPGLPLTLLVEGGQAVLTTPHFNAQCTVPQEWLAAARARRQVYALFATRPWPEAVPGRPVGEEALKRFVANEDVLTTSAHCLLPVRTLQGSNAQ
ncbi:DUF5949 family protein [Streptomyces sp. MST-110588]|uniref:DUF5949 family protein n=1 Tax=Streptomyces sp. MST-110588 TaxID=2833628 RepID=UPI001F5D0F2A|nr:DUF5949 family protein [Streptomyces sp. MST-110588]UNO43205.1 hypothetical protein KGS77_31560 [Streptomyces sp. MST-110588]